ncbi:MAG: GNAT family N-acetyltransferase [Candidatus Cloacimonetes bacterium]|nr:GNAT family N-acetyltransferase [Candidatus Cloacimonadota bacterium]
MIEFKIINSYAEFTAEISSEELIDFLHKHLDKFGDSKEAISECLGYAMSSGEAKGGYVLLALEKELIVGAVIMISTGMKYYIPEYFLVYIAVHREYRNQGLGGKLISRIIEMTDGDIALHVEYENPAKRLYERVGFTSKYAEMRYHKEE